jgi:hypothetical protein
MRKLSDRTRRGLMESLGVPGLLGGLALAILVLGQVFGTAM